MPEPHTALESIVAHTPEKSTSRPGRKARIWPPRCAPSGRLTPLVWALVGALGASLVPDVRAGETLTSLEASVSLSADLSHLKGNVTIGVTNVSSAPLRRVPLWLFPERLAGPPEGLSEVEFPNMFPVGFQPASMRVLSVTEGQGGVPLEVVTLAPHLVQVILKQPVPPGESLSLEVAFETSIPARFGPFGRLPDQLTVDGGAFPRPPPLGAGGFRSDAPPGRVRWSMTLAWEGDAPAALVVNGQTHTFEAAGRARTMSGVAERVSWSLIVSPRVSRFENAGLSFRYLHRRGRCHAAREGAMIDFGCVDAQGQVLASVAASAAWLLTQGPPAPKGEVVLVEAPLRRDVALAAPGMLFVSDRAFELLPIERAHKFHRVALSRALFDVLLAEHLRLDDPLRRAQDRDMVAVALAQSWELHQYGERESGMDVLDEGSFVAAIDDTMAAPQVPFVSTYFVEVDDTDRYRDRFTLFSHRRPSGRLGLAKLRDRLGVRVVDRVIRRMAIERLPLSEALSAEGASDAMGFIRRWDAGAPRLNYRLGEVLTGVDAEGHYVEVEVLRDGEVDRFSEPVSVRVSEGERRLDTVTSISEARTLIRFHSSEPFDAPDVEIDPNGRLVETATTGTRGARRDNRNFSRWRYRIDGIYGTINSASGHLDLRLITSLKPLKEPEHLVVLVASNVERSLGAGGSYYYGFGELVRPNLHRFHVGGGLGLSWLKPSEAEEGGMILTLSTSFSDQTLESKTDPRNGYSWRVGGGPSMLYHEGELSLAASAEAGVTGIVEASPRHVLAGHLRATSLFGELPTTQRLGVGGIGAVRAFATYAQTGRHRLLARAEWRHRWTRDLSWNVMRLFWVRAIDGVAFVDAALLADSPEEFGDPSALFVGAGYGVRFHYLVGGVYPMVFLVDFAVPVLDGGRWGPQTSPGFSTVVGVGQAF